MIRKVQARVKETFPNATLDEQFDERLIYKVPQTDVTSLALIFEMLEKSKATHSFLFFIAYFQNRKCDIMECKCMYNLLYFKLCKLYLYV